MFKFTITQKRELANGGELVKIARATIVEKPGRVSCVVTLDGYREQASYNLSNETGLAMFNDLLCDLNLTGEVTSENVNSLLAGREVFAKPVSSNGFVNAQLSVKKSVISVEELSI